MTWLVQRILNIVHTQHVVDGFRLIVRSRRFQHNTELLQHMPLFLFLQANLAQQGFAAYGKMREALVKIALVARNRGQPFQHIVRIVEKVIMEPLGGTAYVRLTNFFQPVKVFLVRIGFAAVFLMALR